ncbi:hypothetical protein [Cystobacter fuscus]|uniref:hypothetical protein n=1 Tax=Cystobacter fuscus TaxID=43 RepID=UPI002FC5B03E
MSVVGAVAALDLAGCSKPSAPTEDAGTAVISPPDAALAQPGPATFTLRYTLADAGTESIPVVGEEEGRPIVEPTSALELRSSQVLRNYRVRLFDEADRALVSDDTAEESSDGLLYRISLPTPLKSGHGYVLVIDAQTGSSMTDAQGREIADIRMPFQVSGEKEKPPPPPAKKRRSR